jgi:hypothetical protein
MKIRIWTVTHVNKVLAQELERLLNKLAPEEAELASVQVWGAGEFSKEIIPWDSFAPSAGGRIGLLAPRLLALLVAIAQGNLPSAIPDEAAPALEEMARRLAADSSEQVRVPMASREEASVASATVFGEMGWDVTAAQRAAEHVLVAGERVAAQCRVCNESPSNLDLLR